MACQDKAGTLKDKRTPIFDFENIVAATELCSFGVELV